MTIKELLDCLDGNGLIVTDEDLIVEVLNRAFGLAIFDEMVRDPETVGGRPQDLHPSGRPQGG